MNDVNLHPVAFAKLDVKVSRGDRSCAPNGFEWRCQDRALISSLAKADLELHSAIVRVQRSTRAISKLAVRTARYPSLAIVHRRRDETVAAWSSPFRRIICESFWGVYGP